MIRKIVLMLAMLVSIMAIVNAEDKAPHTLTPDDQKNHSVLVKQLSPDQLKLISSLYPDFRILKLCAGHFSGGDHDEVVLGVWKPSESKEWWKREVHRIGIIWNGKAWEIHVIDDEIEKDEEISHSSPMVWQYQFGGREFTGEMKCGIESEFGKNSDLTFILGDKPFFDLKKSGLEKNKVVCFATSNVYNNWDCVVFSPKEKRFKLWFQQAHAD